MSKRKAVGMIQDLKPELSRNQAEQALRTVRDTHAGELTGIAKAQATTTKRSAVTVTQQYRWHALYDAALEKLRAHNTGRCGLTGKTFGEVTDQFIFGGDETCLIAYGGDVFIIGDKAKKKHEAKTGDARVSITMYRIGSVAGVTGPTGFLMAGTKKRHGYSNEFLVKHGAAPGSSTRMPPTGFMTEEAWEEMAPYQIGGIKTIPIIAANPSWICVEILDEFGAHFSSPDSMQKKLDAGIIAVKEEGDSSQVNQEYDKYVAKKDKKVMRETLGLLRRTTSICKGVVDQWGLIHVGLAAVRAVEPHVWIESFKACNLNPHCRVSFEDWCKRISSDLQAGQQFKPPTSDDIYSMLPAWWHGMTPDEKKKVMEVVRLHGDSFSVDCVRQLKSECHIPTKDLQNLRVCIETSKQHPAHLDQTEPSHAAVAVAPEVAAAEAGLKPATHGLVNFELKPQGMTGNELFDHMSQFARRQSMSETLEPSSFLDVEVTEVQKKILNPSARDLTCGALMADAGGQGAQINLAKRKLDNVGDIKAYCGFQNNPERIKKLRAVGELAASISEIARADKAAATAKKIKAPSSLLDDAPAAVAKFNAKGKNAEKLTKKEIAAIALKFFGIELVLSKPKHELVTALQKEIDAKQARGA